MNAVIETAIRRARTVLSLMVLIIGAGMVSYLTIPKESSPDIDIPIIYVSMDHEGISPEDAERLLARPMEQALRSIEGVKEMRTDATEGRASVVLEFEAGFDADQALLDVREKVDETKPELPEDSDEPKVNEVNISLFPVLTVTLAGELPERSLFAIARDLEEDVEALPGVLEADIVGDREELLEISIDPVRLQSYGISEVELFETVARNNRLIAAGALDTGRGNFAVKVPGVLDEASDLLNLPLRAEGEGLVRLRDVASVRRTFKDASGHARVDGKRAVTLEIKKRIGANVIDTIEDVRMVVGNARQGWSEGIKVAFIQDASRRIRNILSDLQNSVLSAILLVMVVVVAALGLGTATLVGLAIPTSLLFGMLVLDGAGLTVNIVVLFSMILAVGMLVDGAIVVTEYADRKMAEGMDRQLAYGEAAKRMAWPITASTATTLAAFMPLLFWPDVSGEFMKFLPITLIAILAGSLVTALIFVPTLGARIGRAGNPDADALRLAEGGDVRALPGFTGAYVRTLDVIVGHPVKMISLALALLTGVWGYYGLRGNGVEFFPDVEPEQALIYVHARGNLSTDEKDALVREVETRVLRASGIETVYTRSGKRLQGDDVSDDVIGIIFLELADWQARAPAQRILGRIREDTADLAGILVETRYPKAGPPTGKDIQIELRSREPARLMPVAERIRDFLEGQNGLIDVEDNRPLEGIEWEIDVDRAQAARFGADIAMVGNVVKLVTNGIKAGDYRPDDADDEIDIRVRFPRDERHIDQIDRLRIATPGGQVPIGNFVTREARAETGTLRRTNGQRAIKVQANVAEGVLADDKVREIRAWMGEQALDPAVEIRFKGADDKQKESMAFLIKAFAVSIFVMGIILVTQFNSFYRAFLILSAVVMSTVGVLLGLLITGQTFGIVMTGIGIISLAGIVVNNNIVLIDTYARLKAAGVATREAILRTGAQRLRPVLLTTVTTITGLLPMVLQLNIDLIGREVSFGAPSTQWWVQLSTAVAFGLGFATLLTLIVTPCLLAFEGWRERRSKTPHETLGEAVPAE